MSDRSYAEATRARSESRPQADAGANSGARGRSVGNSRQNAPRDAPFRRGRGNRRGESNHRGAAAPQERGRPHSRRGGRPPAGDVPRDDRQERDTYPRGSRGRGGGRGRGRGQPHPAIPPPLPPREPVNPATIPLPASSNEESDEEVPLVRQRGRRGRVPPPPRAPASSDSESDGYDSLPDSSGSDEEYAFAEEAPCPPPEAVRSAPVGPPAAVRSAPVEAPRSGVPVTDVDPEPWEPSSVAGRKLKAAIVARGHGYYHPDEEAYEASRRAYADIAKRAAHPTKPLFADVGKSWKPKVNEDSALVANLAKMGIQTIPASTKEHETAGHPISAVVREILTARAFGYIRSNDHLKVVSLYSSPRDLRLLTAMNRASSQQLTLEMYRPQLTSGDMLRRTPRTELHEVDHYRSASAFLMVDVYETDLGSSFNPAFVRTVLSDLSESAMLVWIGHRYLGPAGTVHGEGAWVRTADGKILSRPDHLSSAYAPHDPCDWIWKASFEKFDDGAVCWAHKETAGNMHTIIFRWVGAAKAAQLVNDRAPMENENEQFTTLEARALVPWEPARTIARWFRHNPLLNWFPGAASLYLRLMTSPVKVIVPRSTMTELHAFASVRSFTELTVKQFSVKVRDALSARNAPHELLYRLFPNIRPDIEAVTFALLAERLEVREHASWSFVEENGKSMAQYNANLRALGSPTAGAEEFPWGTLALATAAVGTGFMLWKGRSLFGVPRVSSHLMFSHTRNTFIVPGALTTILGVAKAQLQNMGVHYLAKLPALSSLVNPWTLVKSWALSTATTWCLKTVPIVAFLRSFWSLCSLGLKQLHPELVNPGLFVANVAILAPVYEEMFKRWHPLCVHLLVAVEAVGHGLSGGGVGLARYLPTALMHYIASRMSLGQGIALHAAWNTVAVVGQIAAGIGMLAQAEAQPRESFVPGTLPWRVTLLSLGAILMYAMMRRQDWRPNAWVEHREATYFESWSHRAPISYERQEKGPMPIDKSWVPTQNAYTPLPPLIDPEVLPVYGDIESFRADPEGRPNTVCHWLIGLGVPGYCPARSDYNLATVALCRMLAKPPSTQEENEAGWSKVFGPSDAIAFGNRQLPAWVRDAIPLDRLGDEQGEVPDNFEAWLNHLDSSKKRRAYAAMAEVREAGPSTVFKAAETTPIMVKTDELLYRIDDSGCPELKPRAIANVNPKCVVYLGPSVWATQKRLAKIWSPKGEFVSVRTHRCEFSVKIGYAGAYTDEDLSDWFAMCCDYLTSPARQTEVCVAILVSGDDLHMMLRTSVGQVVVIEGDASMFDQTVLGGALRTTYAVFRYLGLPLEKAQLLWKVAHAKYVLSSRDRTARVILDRSEYPFRDTGGVDTSVGNSVVSALAAYAVAADMIATHPTDLLETDLWAATYQQFGLKMKIRLHSEITGGTFLKGLWYPCVWTPEIPYHFYWGPLPSRLLKATKSLRQPRSLYPEAQSVEEAARCFLSDMAQNYRSFVSVPGLRVLDRFIRGPVVRTDLYGDYKVQPVDRPKPKLAPEAWSLLFYHYGLTREDWESFERFFPDDVYQYCAHPVLVTMALRDYC